jgi:hypothetical protein
MIAMIARIRELRDSTLVAYHVSGKDTSRLSETVAYDIVLEDIVSELCDIPNEARSLLSSKCNALASVIEARQPLFCPTRVAIRSAIVRICSVFDVHRRASKRNACKVARMYDELAGLTGRPPGGDRLVSVFSHMALHNELARNEILEFLQKWCNSLGR